MTAQLSKYINLISTYFKNEPVVRAWLFGSFSRGEEKENSDIDLLVDFDKSKPISLMKMCSMMLDLEDLLGRRVDLIENSRLKEFAAESANNDKILIYERAS